jgi:hypothetical protein
MPGLLSTTPPGLLVDMVQPVNLLHPQNRGLVAWYLALPGITGGSRFVNICRAGDKDGNHGTLTNGPTWGGALDSGGSGSIGLDSTDDTITMDYAALRPSAVTLAMTYNATSVGAVFRSVAGIHWQAGYGFVIAGSANTLRFFINGWDPFYSGGDSQVDAAFTAGVTRRVVGTYDGANVKIYVEGALIDTSGSYTTAINYAPAAEGGVTQPFRIGALLPAGNVPNAGSIDDVRVYNRALSASEVASLYIQSRLGHPDTLNRVRRRSFGYVAAGGGAAMFRRNRTNRTGSRGVAA